MAEPVNFRSSRGDSGGNPRVERSISGGSSSSMHCPSISSQEPSNFRWVETVLNRAKLSRDQRQVSVKGQLIDRVSHPEPISLISKIVELFLRLFDCISRKFIDEDWRREQKYVALSASLFPQVMSDPGIKAIMSTGGDYASTHSATNDKAYAIHTFRKSLIALENAAQAAGERDLRSSARNCHKEFVRSLRKVIESEWYQNEVNAETHAHRTGVDYKVDSLVCSVQKVAFLFYTGAEVQSFSDDIVMLISEHDEIDQEEALQQPNQAILQAISDLNDQREGIKENTQESLGQKIKGDLVNAPFDPQTQGNSPYQKYKMRLHGVERQNIRMSSPTMHSKGNIDPIFESYLQHLRRIGETHTYINFQSNIRSTESRNPLRQTEKARVDAIQAIARKYPDVLIVMSLDKNSTFYKQTGVYGSSLSRSFEFIQLFESNLFDSFESGYALPPCMHRGRKEISKMIHSIHQNFFEGKSVLTQEERVEFIEISYLFLECELLRKTGSKYFNMSCKDCIDRGGGANALMFYAALINQSFEFNSEGEFALKAGEESRFLRHLQAVPSMLFADAIWVRKRAIIKERMEIATGTFLRIYERCSLNGEGAKSLWAEYGPAECYLPDHEAHCTMKVNSEGLEGFEGLDSFDSLSDDD